MCFYNSISRKSYIIIPVGSFCLPRVITTFCHLKKDKCHGEKSYPFDLAFFHNFAKVTELIDKNFCFFYDNLKYKDNQYINNELSAVFNHDGELNIEEFKNRYDNRIKNLYDALKDSSKKIYFVWAGFKGSEINSEQLYRFMNVIGKFRSGNYHIILINCNFEQNNINNNMVSIINNIDINSINSNGNWVEILQNKDNIIYKQLVKELKHIIIRESYLCRIIHKLF